MAIPQENEQGLLIRELLARRPQIIRLLAARLRVTAQAEDIFQELYLKIARLPPEYVVDSPYSFFCRVALNLASDHMRSLERSGKRDGIWLDASTSRAGLETMDETPLQDRALASRALLAQVMAVVESLPPQSRRVFIRHKLDGLSHGEVAAEMGVSKSAIEKHMAVALRRLSSLREAQDA